MEGWLILWTWKLNCALNSIKVLSCDPANIPPSPPPKLWAQSSALMRTSVCIQFRAGPWGWDQGKEEISSMILELLRVPGSLSSPHKPSSKCLHLQFLLKRRSYLETQWFKSRLDKSQIWICVSYLVLCVNGFTEKRGKKGAQCHSSRAIPAAILGLPADNSHLGTPASLAAPQQFLGGIIHLSLNTTNKNIPAMVPGGPPAVKALPQLSHHLNHALLGMAVWGTSLPKSRNTKVHFW